MENQQKPPPTSKGRKRNGMLVDASQMKQFIEVYNEITKKEKETDSHENTNDTNK
jgi:hypothetical protein